MGAYSLWSSGPDDDFTSLRPGGATVHKGRCREPRMEHAFSTSGHKGQRREPRTDRVSPTRAGTDLGARRLAHLTGPVEINGKHILGYGIGPATGVEIHFHL
jgi:hypothetical protein